MAPVSWKSQSSKIFNVLIIKCTFSQDSDRSAFLFCLKVLPFVLFHFGGSSFLTYWCCAGHVLTWTPSQDSGAAVFPAAVHTNDSFWNWCSSSCVGQEGLCANANHLLLLLPFLQFYTRNTMKWGALLFCLYKHLKVPGKQVISIDCKEKLEQYAVEWVIFQTDF